MLTANSIFKRFRYVMKSDHLVAVILTSLHGFSEPLTTMYMRMHSAVETLANDKEQLIVVMETLRLMTRIFYSLNWQDIPEYFEVSFVLFPSLFLKSSFGHTNFNIGQYEHVDD